MSVFDLGGSVGRGMALGQQMTQIRKQNSLADFYKTQGEGLANGDPGALNALAKIDPMAAYDMRRTMAGDQRAAESHGMQMQYTKMQIDQIKANASRQAQQDAAKLDAAQREQVKAQLSGMYAGARAAYMQGPDAFNAWAQQNAQALEGAGVGGLTYENALPVMAQAVGTLEGIDGAGKFLDGFAGGKPDYVVMGGQLVDRGAAGGPAVVPVQGMAAAAGQSAKVQSSVVLDDGTSVLIMSDGTRQVISATGDPLTGQAAADAIKDARAYTVANQTDIYSGRRAGTLSSDIAYGGEAEAVKDVAKATVDAGISAWESYGKLQASLSNIDEAIRAIDSGAASGLVYKMLPSVTEASASLQNAMDRMGLDVIGAVTFGALSAPELKLAMETAAPRNLDPAELRSWLVRRQAAQEKAAAMAADAAQFLTVPGNTINDWIARNRAQRVQQPAAPVAQQPAPQPAAQQVTGGLPDISKMSAVEIGDYMNANPKIPDHVRKALSNRLRQLMGGN